MTLWAADKELSKKNVVAVLKKVFARGKDARVAYAEVEEVRRAFGKEAFRKMKLLVWGPDLVVVEAAAEDTSEDSVITTNTVVSSNVKGSIKPGALILEEEMERIDRAKAADPRESEKKVADQKETEKSYQARMADTKESESIDCVEVADPVDEVVAWSHQDEESVVVDQEEVKAVDQARVAEQKKEENKQKVGDIDKEKIPETKAPSAGWMKARQKYEESLMLYSVICSTEDNEHSENNVNDKTDEQEIESAEMEAGKAMDVQGSNATKINAAGRDEDMAAV